MGSESRSKPKITGVTPSIEHDVNVTLEELLTGCVKKYKIGRDRLKNGRSVREEKIFEINVQKGWKDGTKLRFPHEANEEPSKLAGDIVFILKTKQHDYFERHREDISQWSNIIDLKL